VEGLKGTLPFEAGFTITEEHGILGQTLPDLLGLGSAQPQLAVFQQKPGSRNSKVNFPYKCCFSKAETTAAELHFWSTDVFCCISKAVLYVITSGPAGWIVAWTPEAFGSTYPSESGLSYGKAAI